MPDADHELPVAPEILAYYDKGDEDGRLLHGTGQLELARTQEVLSRFLLPPPATVYDIGGGSGRYACWLARAGYGVHLIDAVPLHVEQARAASDAQPDYPLASTAVGDARALEIPTAALTSGGDAALLLGPLYHLPERDDRIQALREARRVTKPGGVLLAAAISRFASTLAGLIEHALIDPEFRAIAWQDLHNGQHRDPGADYKTPGHRDYFTTAYFHHPDELSTEVAEAGWSACQIYAVEGPCWIPGSFDFWWGDPARREILLEALRNIETEPTLMGASAHIIAVAHAF